MGFDRYNNCCLKTIAADAQTKTEARAHSAPVYGLVRVTTPRGMKALPAASGGALIEMVQKAAFQLPKNR
jgi:hypothetical protein